MERHSDSPSSPGIMMSSTTRSMAAPFITLRAEAASWRRGGAIAMLAQIAGQRLADVARILHQQDMRLGFVFDHGAQF